MTSQELQDYLDELGLTQSEAARLLSVDVRTIRRWFEDPKQISGPAEQALRAWLRLQRLGLAWRPDGLPIGEDEPKELAKQIALYRQQAIQLVTLLQKVKSRNGPAAPWQVDLNAREARLGPMRVQFYPLPNGGFSPATYRRSDRAPDMILDGPLLEDAYACIAAEITKQKRK